MVTNTTSTVNVYLSDISKKDKKWDKHKKDCVDIANALAPKKEFLKRGFNLNQCADWLLYNSTDNPDRPLRLASANFCRDRACPICQWRRSLRWNATMKKQIPAVFEKYPKHRCVFLTLTTKNCPITELRSTIQHINKSFERMVRKVKKRFPTLGYIKSVEVTRNKKTDEAHPHLHIMLFLPAEYFTGRGYMKKSVWAELWQECLKVDYLPVIDIRAVKPKKNIPEASYLDAVSSAIVETVKYAIKPSDLLEKSEDGSYEWMYEYLRQVKGLRFVSIGGIVKGLIKPEWEKDNEENEDLIHVGDDEKQQENEKEPTEIIFNFDRFLWRYKH